MVSVLLSLLLIGYLPGALIFRLPVGRRDLRARLSAEERLFWSVVLSVTLSSVVGLGFAVAGLYAFERLLWVNAGVSAVCLLFGRGRLALPAGTPRVGPSAVIPVGLAVLALTVFFHVPPAEYIIGGRDPGVYMNEGIQIAQRGSVIVDDPLVASIPEEYRSLFFPVGGSPTPHGSRFMAFFIIDADSGSVVGQFPHLYPVWVAIGYGLNGLSGARQVVGVLAVLGVLAVYFCAARMCGRYAGAAAAALLTLNVIQVWYSRYPNAEILTQFLVFSGLLGYGRASIDGDRFFAPAAATLLSLSVLAHFSAMLVVGAVGVALLLGLVDGRRPQPAFVIPLLVGGVSVSLYFATVLSAYLNLPWGLFRQAGPVHITAMIAGGVALGGCLWAVRHERPRRIVHASLPWIVLASLVALTVYAYFFRVQRPGLAIHDAAALREFARVYVSPLGLAAAMIGLVVFVRRSFWSGLAFLTTAAVFSCFIFYKTRIVPEHFWLARRYLPVILPAACVLIGTAVSFPASVALPLRLDRRAIRVGLCIPGGVVLVLLLTRFFSATQPILDYVEYAGVIPRLESLEASFEDDDLVLVEARDTSDLHTLAVPLAYVYARNVLVLVARDPDPELFGKFLTWAWGRYRRVLFVGGGGNRVLSRSRMALPVTGEQFRIPEYERSHPAIPNEVRLKQYDVGIYRLVPQVASLGPFDLDIGAMDDLHVLGFHNKETRSDRSTNFRWTRRSSFVIVQNVAQPIRTLTLWLSAGGRPPTLPPPLVNVFLTDRLLGTVTVADDVQPYQFEIAPDHAAQVMTSEEEIRIEIASNTWSPREALGAADDRELGVMVDRVLLE